MLSIGHFLLYCNVIGSNNLTYDFSVEDPVLYNDAPVGRDPLNDVMKILSQNPELSQIYTNHLIHSTALTILDEHDIASRHIQALPGHKCESTKKMCTKRCPPAKKR